MEVTEEVAPTEQGDDVPAGVNPVVGETMSAVLRSMIADLSRKLDNLRQEAAIKERAAQETKNEIKEIEGQLRGLITGSEISSQDNVAVVAPVPVSAPAVPPPTPAAEPPIQAGSDQQGSSQGLGGIRWVEKGKCKFSCGSTTHSFATDCDVYPTLSDRRDRMRHLKLCFRCFQLRLEPNHDVKCVRVPCFYCTANKRISLTEHHVSVLCPYMFPQ